MWYPARPSSLNVSPQCVAGVVCLVVSSWLLSACIPGLPGGNKNEAPPPGAPAPGMGGSVTAPQAGASSPEANASSGKAEAGDEALDASVEDVGYTALEQGIIALSTQQNDPFLMAMPASGIQVYTDETATLMPFYKTLLAVSPLVSVITPPPEVVETTVTTVVQAPEGPTPNELLASALGGLQVNGISYKPDKPMAVLRLSNGTTALVKPGQVFNVGSASVTVKKITHTMVTVLGKQGGLTQTATLPIADIINFDRAASPVTSASSSAPQGLTPSAATGGGSPLAGGQAQPTAQDIDKIVSDLLK